MVQRAKFQDEINVRCLHPVDDASCVGAAAKGRSASFALHSEMQNIAATQVLAGHYAFYVWIASKENPADAPSSWYGARAHGSALAAEHSDTVGPRRGLQAGEASSVLVLARSCAEEGQWLRHIWSACAERGLRLECGGGHSPEFDLSRDEVYDRLRTKMAGGAVRMILIVLPRDLCLRRSKGTRPAARRSWERRCCRFSRALSLCDVAPVSARHAVLVDASHEGERMSGALADKFRQYRAREDVELQSVDLGRFGSGRPRPLLVASSLEGLRAPKAPAVGNVAAWAALAPPGFQSRHRPGCRTLFAPRWRAPWLVRWNMPDADFVDAVRAYLHEWLESRLTVGVQTRYARARQ